MTDGRLEILSIAAEHRRREVMHYQINIDNYRLAIAEIEQHHAGEQHLVEFAAQMQGLLDSSRREQAKEKILLLVIERQIDEAAAAGV